MKVDLLPTPDLVSLGDGTNVEAQVEEKVRSSSLRLVVETSTDLSKTTGYKMTSYRGKHDGSDVLNRIESGRFGSVWSGSKMDSRVRNGLTVYVKEYRKPHRLVDTADVQTRKFQEIVELRHPCIIEIFYISKINNISYCVMELAEKSVRDVLVRKGRYREVDAREIMSQVVSGLQYLHNRDIVHGHLHVDNILIFPQGFKISDVASGAIIQTVPYHRLPQDIRVFYAPELKKPAARFTKECDIWALGMCLYVITSGNMPRKDPARNNLSIPYHFTDRLTKILRKLVKGTPHKRMSLKSFTESKWFEPKKAEFDSFEEKLAPILRSLEEKASGGMSDTMETIVSKEAGGNAEQGNAMIAGLPSAQDPIAATVGDSEKKSDDKGDKDQDDGEEEGAICSSSVFPKRYYKQFYMIIEENVREEMDPDVFRVEKLVIEYLGRLQNCYRVIMPFKEEPPKPKEELPSTTETESSQSDSPDEDEATKALVPNSAQPIDFSFTDYAPMNFGRYSTTLLSRDEWPAFTCEKEARRALCKQDAERIWNNLNVSVCERCHKAGTDALKHSDENCLYELVSKAVVCDERLFIASEDRFLIRSFTLVYRTDGGRAPAIIRLGRGTIRLVAKGARRIRNIFKRRRDPTSEAQPSEK